MPKEVSADDTEPVGCDRISSSEAALQSALLDSMTLYKALAAKERKDIDMTDITLVGQSRGGLLSVVLAGEGLPGVKKVINFSGSWNTTCNASFASAKFEEYGPKIKVPILSFYGDADDIYRYQNMTPNMAALNKNGLGSSHILKGAGHSLYVRNIEEWVQKVFPNQ